MLEEEVEEVDEEARPCCCDDSFGFTSDFTLESGDI